MTQQIATCPNHPQREAIGICVRCRRRICSECATKVEGINYCVGCLAALAGSQVPRPAAKVQRATAYLSAVAYLAVLSVLFWVLLEALLPPLRPSGHAMAAPPDHGGFASAHRGAP